MASVFHRLLRRIAAAYGWALRTHGPKNSCSVFT